MIECNTMLSALDFLVHLLDVCGKTANYQTAQNIANNETKMATCFQGIRTEAQNLTTAPGGLLRFRRQIKRRVRFHESCARYAEARSKTIKARLDDRQDSRAVWAELAIKALGQADGIAFDHDADLWVEEAPQTPPQTL